MIRVIIADDHLIFRQGLLALLASQEEIEVVGEANSGQEALRIIMQTKPEVAILDISIPAPDGIEVARLVKKNRFLTRIILLTMHKEPWYVEKALRAGVDGYVIKDNAFEDLIEAIKTVNLGEKYISLKVAEKLQQRQKLKGEISSLLTQREREVLKLIATGLTNKQIAKRLSLSVKTIDTHRTNIMQKLNVHTTAELVRFALEVGLID